MPVVPPGLLAQYNADVQAWRDALADWHVDPVGDRPERPPLPQWMLDRVAAEEAYQASRQPVVPPGQS